MSDEKATEAKYMVRGQLVTAEQFRAGADKAKPRKRDDTFDPRTLGTHNGWRVVGHPPGAMEQAREQHQRLHGSKPFDETQWRRNARKLPVRSKPYELLTAAKACAQMAAQAGWLDVEWIELRKERG